MKIGVNLRPLFTGKTGGLEHHFRGVFSAMLRQSGEHRFVLYTHSENEAGLEAFHGRAEFHRLQSPHLTTEVSRAVRDTDPDIVFHPFLFIEPAQLDALNAVLIPDVRYVHYPEQTPPTILRAWRRQFPETARRAEVIFTLSRDSRNDIVKFLDVPREKIHITSPAVESIFFAPLDPETLQSVKARLNLPDRYLFYPADTWPHKNHVRLLEALRLLRLQGMDIPLVLSGYPNAGEGDLIRAIRRCGLESRVIRLGYVARADLPAIYKLSTAMVFPSMYEGWGMPVSEAMAAGTPVICSNRTSVPEVGGEVALYFDPLDVRDIARTLRKALQTPELLAELAAKGPAQARAQTWETAAATTLRAMEHAARPMLELVDPLPLVSIVTPSYQQGKFIERTIQSVLSQDYPRIELIVVDGGSTDETVAILKRYGDRIRWISRRDRGQSDAINQGLKSARGDILAYLNSDDTYLPGAVRRIVSHLASHPACDVVYGQAYYTDSDDKIIEPYPTEPFDEERLKAVCYICQPASFWRRRLHDDIGYFAEDQHLVMDYEFWLRAARRARFAMIDDFLATSRLWEGAKTVDSNARQLFQAMQAVHRYHGDVPSVWLNNYISVYLTALHVNALPAILAIPLRRMIRGWMKTRLTLRFNGWRGLSRPWGNFEKIRVYGDGWMGSGLQERLTVNSTAARLRIRGSLPCWPKRYPPVVEVFANEEKIGAFSLLGTGPFQVEFPLPAALNLLTEMQVRLWARNTFVPADYGIGSDERKLSCHIQSITVEP
jgi:glycosyltransferase involved in cell wall biosynthesis